MFGAYFNASALSLTFCCCSWVRLIRTCTLSALITWVSLAWTETGASVVAAAAGPLAVAGLVAIARAAAHTPRRKAFKRDSGWGSRVARIVRRRARKRWRVVSVGVRTSMGCAGMTKGARRRFL